VATTQQMLDAAKIKPGNRTLTEQGYVDAGKNAGIQSVKNADFKAKEEQKVHGK